MNIVHGGIVMGAYLFVIIVIYIVLSSPFDDMVSSFEDLNMTASDTQVESASGWGRTVFDLVFAGLFIVPFLWFVVLVFRREPDWRYPRR